MENFLRTIRQFVQPNAESLEVLTSCMLRSELPKGHVLVRPDTVCDRIFFVDRGLARTFYYRDGKDITDWISDEGSFSVSILSFITQQADRRGMELLESSTLYSLSYADLERLSATHHDVEKIYRHLVCSGLIQLQQKFDALHFSTAAERYQTLIRDHPTFLQRMPLGMLASYLGMTQETLSRIRARA